jgi:hypothetical protein
VLQVAAYAKEDDAHNISPATDIALKIDRFLFNAIFAI